MSTQLMIVEDDNRMRAALRLAMEGEGYEVAEAEAAESALRQLREQGAPDVMIIDLTLGGMDGFTCVREIRRDHDVPIIVVGAGGDSHDVVAALEAGADDFVAKPFEVKVISARMRALRRRAGLTAERDAPQRVVLDADPGHRVVLAPERGTVHRCGTQLHLTRTEFRLLCELATSGRVLSRAELLARVWDRGFYGDERIVDVHLRRLRTKIERDPAEPRIVVTVRGLGYRLDPQR